MEGSWGSPGVELSPAAFQRQRDSVGPLAPRRRKALGRLLAATRENPSFSHPTWFAEQRKNSLARPLFRTCSDGGAETYSPLLITMPWEGEK